MNIMHARKAGAMRESDGRPSARMAKVMYPANETESTTACETKVHRDTRDIPAGVLLRSI